MTSEYAWIISCGLIMIILAAFLYVAVNAGDSVAFEGVQKKAYRIRTVFFWFLIIAGIPIAGLTLTELPYNAHEKSTLKPVSVEVTGHQWYWTISQTEFEAGHPVLFNVGSADATHGFGIYNADLKLLTQTQAMPGYINKLFYTFEQPGIYKVMCLEYCGIAHHVMITELKVVTKKSEGAAQ